MTTGKINQIARPLREAAALGGRRRGAGGAGRQAPPTAGTRPDRGRQPARHPPDNSDADRANAGHRGSLDNGGSDIRSFVRTTPRRPWGRPSTNRLRRQRQRSRRGKRGARSGTGDHRQTTTTHSRSEVGAWRPLSRSTPALAATRQTAADERDAVRQTSAGNRACTAAPGHVRDPRRGSAPSRRATRDPDRPSVLPKRPSARPHSAEQQKLEKHRRSKGG